MLLGIEAPRVGSTLDPQPLDLLGPEPFEVLAVVRGLEDPVPDPLVVVVAAGRGARLDPEVVVLAVALDGQAVGVEATRMSTERCLADREHAVCGNAHEVRVIGQRRDDLLDRHDRAATRGQRTPHPFEQRRGNRNVAGRVGDRRVQDRDVGRERGEQTDRAVRRVDHRVPVVGRHRRARDRAGRDRGQALGRGFEPLGEREEGPVLHLHRAGLVRPLEPRVRREVRERVARVTGHDPVHQAAPEEQRAQAREAQHHQLEVRVLPPPLPHDLACRGAPARVPDDEVQRVASVDVLGHRRLDGHRSRHAQPALVGLIGPRT